MRSSLFVFVALPKGLSISLFYNRVISITFLTIKCKGKKWICQKVV